MAIRKNKWSRPTEPPPPMFVGKKERDLVKQVNDEIVERVVGQQVLYYPVDIETTNYHPLYGEAIEKNYLPPIRVYAFVELTSLKTETTDYGVDKLSEISVYFHKRRLSEDQNLYVREGDYVLYGEYYYEITSLDESRRLFGQMENRFEIVAKCIRAREGLFDGR